MANTGWRPDPPTAEQQPPTEFANVPPPAMLDYSFTLQAIMELHKLVAEVGTKTDRLIADTSDGTRRIGSIEQSITRFKTAIISVGVCLGILLPAFGGILWWAVGERINNAFHNAEHPTVAVPQPAPPVARPKP